MDGGGQCFRAPDDARVWPSFYGGMVDRKNVISTMLQSFVALGVISILWVVVGFSLCFGDSMGGIIGNPLTFMNFKACRSGPAP